MKRLIRLLMICTALLLSGCTIGGSEKALLVGDEVEGTLKGPGAVERWSFRTTSDSEVITFHVTGTGKVPLKGIQTRVFVPGDALAAQLATSAQKEFGAGVVGRATTWTVELRLEESATWPVPYRFRVSPWRSTPRSAPQSPCETTLQGLGIWALIILLPNIPNPYIVTTDPTLGISPLATAQPLLRRWHLHGHTDPPHGRWQRDEGRSRSTEL